MYFNINIPHTNYDTNNITDNLKNNDAYKKSTVIKHNTDTDTF